MLSIEGIPCPDAFWSTQDLEKIGFIQNFFTVYGRFGFEIIGLTLPLTFGQTRFAIERNSQQEKWIWKKISMHFCSKSKLTPFDPPIHTEPTYLQLWRLLIHPFYFYGNLKFCDFDKISLIDVAFQIFLTMPILSAAACIPCMIFYHPLLSSRSESLFVS